jgi:hypothetical protein
MRHKSYSTTQRHKSRGASAVVAEPALAAAEQSFAATAPLPFDATTPPPHGTAHGRRRLTGAFLIRTDRIVPDAEQPRRAIDPQTLSELTASVKRLGILQPITVRWVNRSSSWSTAVDPPPVPLLR